MSAGHAPEDAEDASGGEASSPASSAGEVEVDGEVDAEVEVDGEVEVATAASGPSVACFLSQAAARTTATATSVRILTAAEYDGRAEKRQFVLHARKVTAR
jgi:hypothetical protein